MLIQKSATAYIEEPHKTFPKLLTEEILTLNKSTVMHIVCTCQRFVGVS